MIKTTAVRAAAYKGTVKGFGQWLSDLSAFGKVCEAHGIKLIDLVGRVKIHKAQNSYTVTQQDVGTRFDARV